MRGGLGDPEPHMPKTAEIVQPRSVSQGAQRVRKRRDNLVPLLEQLAYNLRWSWDPKTRDLFQSLAPDPWARTHNPIAVLKSAANDPDRLAEHAESILERHGDLDQYLNRAPHVKDVPRIAYFARSSQLPSRCPSTRVAWASWPAIISKPPAILACR